MKKVITFLVCCLFLTNTAVWAQKRIFMIGDSTMADKDLFRNVTDSVPEKQNQYLSLKRLGTSASLILQSEYCSRQPC